MTDTTLQTGKIYIKDLFGSSQFYNIPEYQRPYSWEEKDIRALLEDISGAMEENEEKEYFLGCMIWNACQVKGNSGSNIDKYLCYDILDGQQRFITLFLLQAVIRDIPTSAQEESKERKSNIQKKLHQEENKYDNIPERNRIEFQIRNDQDFFHKYLIEDGGTLLEKELKAISGSAKENISLRNMASGILVIKNWWKNKLSEIEDEKKEEYICRFLRYLSNKVLVLYLSTSNNLDDAYNLFTVINNRGVQLQPSDVIKAQNLREIKDDELRKRYAKKWDDFENIVSAPYNSFSSFLMDLVYIKMKYHSEENKTILKGFEVINRKEIPKGQPMLDFIEKYVDHYSKITDFNKYTSIEETSALFYNLNLILSNTFGSQYLMPLMHYRERFGEIHIMDFIIKIDNLVSVMWLLGRQAEIKTRIFIILRRIDNIFESIQKGEISAGEATEELLNNSCLQYDFVDETSSTKKPIIFSDFILQLENENWGFCIGTQMYKTRYLLLKMDILMGGTNTILQYGNKGKSPSIEHLMPQRIEAAKWNIDSEDHKEWVHKLGNLILIDKNLNSSLSNSSFNEKRKKYQSSIESRANTNYIFITHNEWNIDAIKTNHKRTVNLLKRYYEGNSLETFYQIKKQLKTTDHIVADQCYQEKMYIHKEDRKYSDSLPPFRLLPFSFDMVGIKPGEQLTFIPTGEKVTVTGKKTIEYAGRIYSLSGFTREFMPVEKRAPSGAYQGPKYFLYNGKTLADLRGEIE